MFSHLVKLYFLDQTLKKLTMLFVLQIRTKYKIMQQECKYLFFLLFVEQEKKFGFHSRIALLFPDFLDVYLYKKQ